MIRTLIGFDWQKSNPHWLLLSKFIHPRSPDDFIKTGVWIVLGEPPKRAIERFAREGLLVSGELVDLLSYRYRVPELKEMLRQQGLSIAGCKQDMIQRLVSADPEGMRKATSGLKVLVCTQRGNELVNEYLTSEKRKRSRVEQKVLEYLKKRDFISASLAVAVYEAEHVFSHGYGMDCENYNPEREIGLLNSIFNCKPKILAQLENDKLESIRIGAAMMALWGNSDVKQWLPSNFNTGIHVEKNTAARMLWFYALRQASLKQIRDSGLSVKYVKIHTEPDSCDTCKKLNNNTFTLEDLPELPYEHCTSEQGCRCLEMAEFK